MATFKNAKEEIKYFKKQGADVEKFAGGIADNHDMTKDEVMDMINEDDSKKTDPDVAAKRRARRGHNGQGYPG